MFPRDVRPGQDECHDILDLIPEPIRPARLIEGRPCPDAARKRLIEKPAVQEEVHGTVRTLHLDSAEEIVPETGHLLQEFVNFGFSVLVHKSAGLARGTGIAQEEDHLHVFVRLELETGLESTAWILSGADVSGECRSIYKGGGTIMRSVPAEKLFSVGSPAHLAPPQ